MVLNYVIYITKEEEVIMKKFGGAIAFIGAVFLFLSFREGIAAMRPMVDLYGEETNVDEIGYFDMVYADVYAVFGYCASEETTKNGVKQKEDYYYVIPAFKGDDMYYIALKVSEGEQAKYERQTDRTYDYMMGYDEDVFSNTIPAQGTLKKMGSELKKYYYDWFREGEVFESEEEMKEYAMALYIDQNKNPRGSMILMFVGAGALIAGCIILVLGFVRENSVSYKAKNQTYVMINGVSYSKLSLAHVNQSIQNQETVFAAQELSQITGISLEEAGRIIDNWNEYYL